MKIKGLLASALSCVFFQRFFKENQFIFTWGFLRILLTASSMGPPVIASVGTCVIKFISVDVWVPCVHVKLGLEMVQVGFEIQWNDEHVGGYDFTLHWLLKNCFHVSFIGWMETLNVFPMVLEYPIAHLQEQ